MEDYDAVRADFNEIAALEDANWNHNNCYYPCLLRLLPQNPGRCLEIGCGKGALSRLLSGRAESVTAVDLADGMIRRAREENPAPNLTYLCGNILDMSFPDGSLDAILTVATAHHLPFEWLLRFGKDKLRPGGRLLILDLFRAETPGDYLAGGAAAVANVAVNLLKNGRPRKDGARARAAWEQHGRHDSLMTLRQVRRLAESELPGAAVERKLFWRYLLIWTK